MIVEPKTLVNVATCAVVVPMLVLVSLGALTAERGICLIIVHNAFCVGCYLGRWHTPRIKNEADLFFDDYKRWRKTHVWEPKHDETRPS